MAAYPQHKLLTSQQDTVFALVRGSGFDPIEFEWTSTFGDSFKNTVPCLVHKPTDSAFTFDFDSFRGDHCVEYTPGSERPTNRYDAGDWATVTLYVRNWLENVERERSSPNFWAELGKQRELLSATEPSGDDDNSPFTPEEQAEVVKQLHEIKELLVQTHQADPAALESRVDYLIDASTRMGRRDWLNIFYGGIFSWALTGLVPPEGVREVLAIASQGLGHLFGGGVPQLPMP
jgi:hypothetical protein